MTMLQSRAQAVTIRRRKRCRRFPAQLGAALKGRNIESGPRGCVSGRRSREASGNNPQLPGGSHRAPRWARTLPTGLTAAAQARCCQQQHFRNTSLTASSAVPYVRRNGSKRVCFQRLAGAVAVSAHGFSMRDAPPCPLFASTAAAIATSACASTHSSPEVLALSLSTLSGACFSWHGCCWCLCGSHVRSSRPKTSAFCSGFRLCVALCHADAGSGDCSNCGSLNAPGRRPYIPGAVILGLPKYSVL